jgi:glutamyl-tRNA synthetase
LPDFVEQARPFLAATVEYDPDAMAKHLSAPDLADHVAALIEALRNVEPFDEVNIERALRAVAGARGIKAGVLIHAARVAVTGKAVSPGLFEVLTLLGRDRTIARLEHVARFLKPEV